jgi:hypothetical protein
MVARQSVFSRIKQKTVKRRSGLFRGCFNTLKFWWLKLSMVLAAVCDGHYHATLRHLSTIVFGIWFKYLVSVGPEAFHYNKDWLLLYSSLGNVPKLALAHLKKCH